MNPKDLTTVDCWTPDAEIIAFAEFTDKCKPAECEPITYEPNVKKRKAQELKSEAEELKSEARKLKREARKLKREAKKLEREAEEADKLKASEELGRKADRDNAAKLFNSPIFYE